MCQEAPWRYPLAFFNHELLQDPLSLTIAISSKSLDETYLPAPCTHPSLNRKINHRKLYPNLKTALPFITQHAKSSCMPMQIFSSQCPFAPPPIPNPALALKPSNPCSSPLLLTLVLGLASPLLIPELLSKSTL